MRTAGPEWVISFTGYSSCDRYEILLAFSFNERQITVIVQLVSTESAYVDDSESQGLLDEQYIS